MDYFRLSLNDERVLVVVKGEEIFEEIKRSREVPEAVKARAVRFRDVPPELFAKPTSKPPMLASFP